MAGGSTSEEMDAFDDVTPAKPVSIYDLDEDLPTRAQSSEEIAEFQEKARAKRESAHRSFKAPVDAPSPSGRPIPRESGPVLIDRMRVPAPLAAGDEPELDAALRDVAATLQRLPPAPRLPRFDVPQAAPERTRGASAPPSRSRLQAWDRAIGMGLLGACVLALAVAAAWIFVR